jgi:hypothetical protein
MENNNGISRLTNKERRSLLEILSRLFSLHAEGVHFHSIKEMNYYIGLHH